MILPVVFPRRQISLNNNTIITSISSILLLSIPKFNMILHLTYDAISRYVFETIPTRILLPILTAHQDTSGDNNEEAAGGGIVHVSTTHLIATALPLLLIAAVGRHFDLGIENNGLMVGIARSFVQLNILGIILQPIFVLGMDMAWVVGLCEYYIWLFLCITMTYFFSC